MHGITIYPLGNADSCRIELDNGKQLLFDYANVHDKSDSTDKRIDLAATLRAVLKEAKRDYLDIVAFTHLDDDHIHGASDFFELLHVQKYQGSGRIRIRELWVPAAAVIEEGLSGEARIIRSEARHRLVNGTGIRVFSRPESLSAWLRMQGLSLESRRHLITDAGQLVPGLTLAADNVEFFVHAPFAEHAKDGTLIERNTCLIVLHATFSTCAGRTRVLFGSDIDYEGLSAIVNITKWHRNEDRLRWDAVKVPHHCSYTALNGEQGSTITTPVPEVSWLYEQQGSENGVLVATCKAIPTDERDSQPPHRQAAAYYREVARRHGGEFVVTMAHPSESRPEPLVLTIDRLGITRKKTTIAAAAAIAGVRAPRAG